MCNQNCILRTIAFIIDVVFFNNNERLMQITSKYKLKRKK